MSLSLLISFATLVPWVHGFSATGVTEGDAEGPAWLDDDGSGCGAEGQPPLQVTAEVSPAAGSEVITASLTGGMQITSAEGVELAAMPGFPCEGSADSLDVLAAGTLFGEPTILLAITTGGHHEQMTWIGVFRIGFGGDINALFAGAVEIREGDVTRTGDIAFLPGALIYRPPGRGPSLWVLDPVIHTYFPRGPFDHEAPLHVVRPPDATRREAATLARNPFVARARGLIHGPACSVAAMTPVGGSAVRSSSASEEEGP